MKTHYKNVGIPIFESLYDAKLIEKKIFALCLGKDGGSFQIGGVNEELHLDKAISWMPLKNTNDYKIDL